jgi:hypothetical protein
MNRHDHSFHSPAIVLKGCLNDLILVQWKFTILLNAEIEIGSFLQHDNKNIVFCKCGQNKLIFLVKESSSVAFFRHCPSVL